MKLQYQTLFLLSQLHCTLQNSLRTYLGLNHVIFLVQWAVMALLLKRISCFIVKVTLAMRKISSDSPSSIIGFSFFWGRDEWPFRAMNIPS
jgi:hypothetical protein